MNKLKRDNNRVELINNNSFLKSIFLLFIGLIVSSNISAQNVHQEESGAYTGEISAQMLKSVGVGYVIIGHSVSFLFN